MRKIALVVIGLSALAFSIQAQSNEIQTNGRVCGLIPNNCSGFGSENLAFRLPAKLAWQKNYYSAFFYAVMLKSRPKVNDRHVDDDRCRLGYYAEEERVRIQKLFPQNKVFASRNGCYFPIIWYTNVNAEFEFIAVYAGETEAAAKIFLKKVKQRSEFSDANIRRMKVVFGNGD